VKKRTLILLSLSLAIIMAVSVFAIARPKRGGVIDAIYSEITIMKTFDLYGVICVSEVCCEQGKCLGTIDADTHLSVCGLQFDQENTEYWVYITDDEGNRIEVGSCVNGICSPVCVSQPSEDGRVTYELIVKAKNPGKTKSLLTSVTLCLAATATSGERYYVGSDYEQPHYDPGTDAVILPDPDFPESGQNIILCPVCPQNL
jgi:hypothetical protein